MKHNPPQKVVIGIPRLAMILEVGEPRVREYIRAGMPAVFLFGRWHFHLEAVFDWFRDLSLSAENRKKRPDPEKVTEDSE